MVEHVAGAAVYQQGAIAVPQDVDVAGIFEEMKVGEDFGQGHGVVLSSIDVNEPLSGGSPEVFGPPLPRLEAQDAPGLVNAVFPLSQIAQHIEILKVVGH